MSKKLVLNILLACWGATAWAVGGGGGAPAVESAGLIQFDPPQVRACVAVRIEVPEDKMVTGVRWYNGSGTEAFPRILVASGSQLAPPPYGEAVALAEGVVGLEGAWSSAVFAAPVASESGTLFVLIEYPPDYAPPAEGAALGIGYAQAAAVYPHFVSGDGLNWVRIAMHCRILLEPVLADRLPGIVTLRSPESESPTVEIVERRGLFAAPNPFNPQTKIELSLATATTGSLRIYDVRGRLVVELHRGAFARGANTFVWNGRDSRGRAVASGAYWVQAHTDDQSLTKKVLLLK